MLITAHLADNCLHDSLAGTGHGDQGELGRLGTACGSGPVYASGMSISRDAVSRNVHPHLDESVGPDTALARPLTHMYVACVRIPTTDFC